MAATGAVVRRLNPVLVLVLVAVAAGVVGGGYVWLASGDEETTAQTSGEWGDGAVAPPDIGLGKPVSAEQMMAENNAPPNASPNASRNAPDTAYGANPSMPSGGPGYTDQPAARTARNPAMESSPGGEAWRSQSPGQPTPAGRSTGHSKSGQSKSGQSVSGPSNGMGQPDASRWDDNQLQLEGPDNRSTSRGRQESRYGATPRMATRPTSSADRSGQNQSSPWTDNPYMRGTQNSQSTSSGSRYPATTPSRSPPSYHRERNYGYANRQGESSAAEARPAYRVGRREERSSLGSYPSTTSHSASGSYSPPGSTGPGIPRRSSGGPTGASSGGYPTRYNSSSQNNSRSRYNPASQNNPASQYNSGGSSTYPSTQPGSPSAGYPSTSSTRSGAYDDRVRGVGYSAPANPQTPDVKPSSYRETSSLSESNSYNSSPSYNGSRYERPRPSGY